MLKKLDEALEQLCKAYEAEPNNIDTALSLAQHYADRGWYNRAIDIYRKIVRQYPNHYVVLLDYGNVCFRKGDYSQALAIFCRLTEMNPERVEGWNNLGICYLKTENYEAALASFERVLALEPANVGALINLGNCYQAVGELEKAEKLFRQATTAQSDFADAWFNLGNVQLLRKAYEGAVESFRKVLRYQPEFFSAIKNIGVAYEEMGQYEAALQHYRRALQLNRADAGIYLNIANVFLKKRKYEDARHYYMQSVKLAPREIGGWLGLRHLALLRGDVQAYGRATLAVLPHIHADTVAESIRILRGLQQMSLVDEILDTADRLEKHSDELDAERLLAYQRRQIQPDRIGALRQHLHSLMEPSVHIKTCLAQDCLLNSQFDETLHWLSGVDCSEPQRQILLWKAFIGKGAFETAAKMIYAFLEEHSDWGDGWCYAAIVELRRGSEEKAKELLLRALECGAIDPALVESDPQLLNIYRSLG